MALAAITLSPAHAMYEQERLAEYEKRNYTWPPQRYIPDTPGWRKLMEERFEQVQEMPKSGDRYEGYLQVVHAALLAPNFTELGFGLARAPEPLMKALRKGIREGVATAREEGTIDVIGGPHRPWFVDRPDLTKRVLDELQPYPEAWAGRELVPFRAYGFRLYRNESTLYMHVDKPETHIVSLILHIDSSVSVGSNILVAHCCFSGPVRIAHARLCRCVSCPPGRRRAVADLHRRLPRPDARGYIDQR